MINTVVSSTLTWMMRYITKTGEHDMQLATVYAEPRYQKITGLQVQ